MSVIGHILGFPRIGLDRELKFALERYWLGKINQDDLLNVGKVLRTRHWKQQKEAGIDLISVGDFAWYDHVLTTSAMVDNIPLRHLLSKESTVTIDSLFRTARGYSISNNCNIAPSEMKKWFNTNYHYIVPEFSKNKIFKLNWTQLLDEVDEALSLKYLVKPILLGPMSYLWLGKVREENFDKLSLLPSLLSVYCEVLEIFFDKGIEWVQIDEPILVLELPRLWLNYCIKAYCKLHGKVKLLLTTYFDSISHNLDIIKKLSIDGLHVDLVSGTESISVLHKQLPSHWVLSAGVINGRNIWKTNLYDWFNKLLSVISNRVLWIGSSCSLLHVPIDLSVETKLDTDIQSWFSFALQKCSEIKMLCDALNSNDTSSFLIRDTLKKYYFFNDLRTNSNLVNNSMVKERLKIISDLPKSRNIEYFSRAQLQRERFKLPLYPTTTIGSFPQTQEIRDLRLNLKTGKINSDYYCVCLKKYIKKIIIEQEKLGLDVLVHGEPERNDMVEYFAEHLNGFAFTKYGWVQSYGSRCVKPPIIIGDINRVRSITKKWINYAQSLTKKPVKGILTGPVTIMTWSFVREDIERSEITLQLVLSIRDEVLDLEKSGVGIIQVDEPALIEALPLKLSNQKQYLEWAIDAFKLTVSSVKKDTQIHTHICYSEFNKMMCDLFRLDADVVSIEASRSDLKLLEVIRDSEDNLNEIGLGIYDIHSTNAPLIEDLVNRLNQYLKYIPIDRLWINPDCGLKTRTWIEVKRSLENMVTAAKLLRLNSLQYKDCGSSILAILPGDPDRVRRIALLMHNPRYLSSCREFTIWSSEIYGNTVIVCSTGIGGPSTSIVVEELSQLGIRIFLRIGTAGAIQSYIQVGDILVITAAVRCDGASQHYAPIEFPAVSDFFCSAALIQAAELIGAKVHSGISVSSDTFYPGQERKNTYSGYIISKFRGSLEEWKKLGVLSYEMESSTLLTMCASQGLKAGVVVGVVVNRLNKEIPSIETIRAVETTAIRSVIKAAGLILTSKSIEFHAK